MRLPTGAAGDLVREAIEAAGGWEAWADKSTVSYRKTTERLDADGEVTRTVEQVHRYVLHPFPRMRIDWEEDGRAISLINDGQQAWKTVDGVHAAARSDRDQAWNSTFGSHYVFCMPFKLTDPGTRLATVEPREIGPGRTARGVRVGYEPWAGSAGGMHTWTYYFDEAGLLVANHLEYGPKPDDYSLTLYHDHAEIDGLRMPTRRTGWSSNAAGERLAPSTRISYSDVVFDVELPDGLFALPDHR